MKIQFKPKVIIGSILGFLTTTLGIIAAFFPGVFNMEKEKIYQYEETLKSPSDYYKFIDYLLSKENKIVSLNITYFEKDKYNYVNYQPSRFNINKKNNIEGEGLFSTIDDNGYIHVGSNYKIRVSPSLNFFRTQGGFGVWIVGNAPNGDADRFYVIDISRDSDHNKLYKWYMLNGNEMKLEGNFLVKSPIDSREYKDTYASLSPQWTYAYCDNDEMFCPTVETIELVPVSKKELELKKY